MKEILFFKGNHETIILPRNSGKTKIFYDRLFELFESKGYKIKIIETYSKKQLKENISSETKYLIGHSQGATRILEQYDLSKHTNIEGIVIFDPSQRIEEIWNSLELPSLLFASSQDQYYSYSGFRNIIWIDDDHYFSVETEKVLIALREFL